MPLLGTVLPLWKYCRFARRLPLGVRVFHHTRPGPRSALSLLMALSDMQDEGFGNLGALPRPCIRALKIPRQGNIQRPTPWKPCAFILSP